jgi:hypothetical protein
MPNVAFVLNSGNTKISRLQRINDVQVRGAEYVEINCLWVQKDLEYIVHYDVIPNLTLYGTNTTDSQCDLSIT